MTWGMRLVTQTLYSYTFRILFPHFAPNLITQLYTKLYIVVKLLKSFLHSVPWDKQLFKQPNLEHYTTMLTIKYILSKPYMYIRCQKSKISNTFQDFNVVYCIVYSHRTIHAVRRFNVYTRNIIQVEYHKYI